MMDKQWKAGVSIIITLLAYLSIDTIIGFFSSSKLIGLIAKLVIVTALLIIYRDTFRFKPKFDLLSFLVGLIIGFGWFLIDGTYPHLGASETYYYNGIEAFIKLMIGFILAPIVEEFFTRFFMHRVIASDKWLNSPLGKFSLIPFIITTLFFGFSHNRWLAGLLTGALLNWLWYQRKDMNSVVLAHATANLVLGIIVINFGYWQFW